MKKKLSMFLAAGLFTLLICLSLFEVGCTSVTPMLAEFDAHLREITIEWTNQED
jgi:hypothetical protein